MASPSHAHLHPRDTHAWVALLGVCIALYFWGLGNPYAPTNGDEMVYIHIARMTAESGQWLPLQSELLGTRNTKPPLLIWQAMVAGQWGHAWTLWALRLPSVLYTLATTALLGWMAWRLTPQPARQLRNACIAACLYLLFFSTFRYGRAYLTSAPETFWLALPMVWVFAQRLRPVASQPLAPPWLACTLMGLAMGVGSAYKSFALIAPAAASVWLAWLASAPQPLRWGTLWRTSLGLAWSTVVALAVFGLWFVLDPNPAAVWQEFVVAENAGKMSSTQGYWQAALHGAYPMWVQLLAHPANGGLLALPVLGYLLHSLGHGRWGARWQALGPGERVLLGWLVLWMLVFLVPTQRSERYLIPTMPALAVLMALGQVRIARGWWMASSALLLLALVMLGRIGWVMGALGIASMHETATIFIAISLGVASGIALFYWKFGSMMSTLALCATVYATFAAMVAPLQSQIAPYDEAVRSPLQGKAVAVPNGFTGQYERFHFRLPHSRVVPYDSEGRNTGALYPEMEPQARLQRLLAEFDAVVWVQGEPGQAPPCTDCRVLAQRWHIKSRHRSGEVTLDNLWRPQEWLFRQEWLLAPSKP